MKSSDPASPALPVPSAAVASRETADIDAAPPRRPGARGALPARGRRDALAAVLVATQAGVAGVVPDERARARGSARIVRRDDWLLDESDR